MSNRNYVFDPVNNSLTITKAFAEKLQDPSSMEYAFFRAIKADNPSIAVYKRTHITKSGTVNKNKKLTYENMIAYMKLLPNSEKYLTVFDSLRTCANLLSISPYVVVSKWFVEQFPKYREDPVFYLTNEPKIISAEIYIKKVERAKAA